MNKKKNPAEEKIVKPGDSKTKLNVGVAGNPKLNKPAKKKKA